eukprot:15440980-Alexandrium_andersonii.AAC.1
MPSQRPGAQRPGADSAVALHPKGCHCTVFRKWCHALQRHAAVLTRHGRHCARRDCTNAKKREGKASKGNAPCRQR